MAFSESLLKVNLQMVTLPLFPNPVDDSGKAQRTSSFDMYVPVVGDGFSNDYLLLLFSVTYQATGGSD